MTGVAGDCASHDSFPVSVQRHRLAGFLKMVGRHLALWGVLESAHVAVDSMLHRLHVLFEMAALFEAAEAYWADVRGLRLVEDWGRFTATAAHVRSSPSIMANSTGSKPR